MKFREIRQGIWVPVSNEEQALIDLIEGAKGIIKRAELDERQRELARKLVSRDILHRTRRDESLYYVLADMNKLLGKHDGEPNV
jgi:hypothetical protein